MESVKMEDYGLLDTKVEVRFELLNWDKECEIDMIS
jgi:hypothetical protein